MKKALKIIFITLLVFYVLMKIFNLTGVLNVFTVNGISSEPNIKANSRIISSNFFTPKVGDFIMLKLNDTLTVVHRLCARENDKVEIKDGILYVNNKNSDEKLSLMYRYKMPSKKFVDNQIYGRIPSHIMMQMEENDTVYAFLSDQIAKELHIESSRIIHKKGVADEHIKKVHHKDWNKDNFGPITIPVGKIFVLGDNRDNAEDSRYIGLIDNSKIVGTVIYK
ncbi:signal peptidase I [Flavobacterium sp. 102]|uniref:signal peptidase I n=1 Tax=Flavobacterium sp. 102 TaxID=2135623 RepID=UPI000EB3A63D|nr:signal peptidase I [Flavobacterium sp. 102]RKS03680.1 signal peptidase I [Flavobacterium sp. 102]